MCICSCWPKVSSKRCSACCNESTILQSIWSVIINGRKRWFWFANKGEYDQLVHSLQQYKTTKRKDQFMQNAWNRFSLGNNVKNSNLFCKVLHKEQPEIYRRSLPWSKWCCMKLFEVIHETHIELSHATCSRTHKSLSEKSVHPLKMIISNTIGIRA